MKTIQLEEYKDKVLGCWTGKNIGGVLGAPFEGMRKVNDVNFYTQDLSAGPPPNDDLDLQIVWLEAARRYGRNVNAAILGEYWLSYIIPNWVEYGTGKANLKAGLMPPLSGEIDNTYKNSNGCFIRSEIWACLAPGHPEIATKYAYEDAIVDHAGEGVFGEIFFAALESASFVEKDKRRLIEIGLSYIPAKSLVSKAVESAIECYDNQVPFLDARRVVHNIAPGTFGVQNLKLDDIPTKGNEGMEIGEPGMDAPENVAFTILGWLYGEDDFGKSICLANSCGEDTDCTAATLGAILGIVCGESGLPDKWKKPLNDKIATLCIDKTSHGIWVPETATQLTERVIKVMPYFLGLEYCNILGNNGIQISCLDDKELSCRKEKEYLQYINGNGKSEEMSTMELCKLTPYMVRYSFPAFQMMIDYGDSVYFSGNSIRRIKVTVWNSNTMCEQQWTKITVYPAEGMEIIGDRSVQLPLNNLVGSKAEVVFCFQAAEYKGAELEFLVEASLIGRHSTGTAKVTLMRKGSLDQGNSGNNQENNN